LVHQLHLVDEWHVGRQFHLVDEWHVGRQFHLVDKFYLVHGNQLWCEQHLVDFER
jgi:hypothetical protein